MGSLAIEERPEPLIGGSPQMIKIRKQVARIARLDTPVLISGEPGSGMETVARTIHQASSRAAKGFFGFDLGGLPEQLHGIGLFGNAHGAFKWAKHAHPGLLEEAQGGTVFLPSVTHLQETAIPGLLRALRERVVCRIGDDRLIPIDVRVVAACHMEPGTPKPEGWPRDLYRALGPERIHVPALRERPEDIPVLARYLLDRYANESARPFTGFSPDALAALTHYSWPGNIRELQNVIERAVVLGSTPMILCDDVRVY